MATPDTRINLAGEIKSLNVAKRFQQSDGGVVGRLFGGAGGSGQCDPTKEIDSHYNCNRAIATAIDIQVLDWSCATIEETL